MIVTAYRTSDLLYDPLPPELQRATFAELPETLLGDDAPPREGAAIRSDDGVLFVDGVRLGTVQLLIDCRDDTAEGRGRVWFEVVYTPEAHL